MKGERRAGGWGLIADPRNLENSRMCQLALFNVPRIENYRHNFIGTLGFFFSKSATLAMSCSNRHSSVNCY